MQMTYCFPLYFSVFWDLYCAAPERRDTCDHSSEAKAFHDYVSIHNQGPQVCCPILFIYRVQTEFTSEYFFLVQE